MIFNVLIFLRVNALFPSYVLWELVSVNCLSENWRQLCCNLPSLDQQLLLVNKKLWLIFTLLSNYLTKATPHDNTLGIVFYNILLWCIVWLSSILVFFLTSVKEDYILQIQMLIKYSLLHFIYLCKQIAINSTLVLATTCDKCNVF